MRNVEERVTTMSKTIEYYKSFVLSDNNQLEKPVQEDGLFITELRKL